MIDSLRGILYSLSLSSRLRGNLQQHSGVALHLREGATGFTACARGSHITDHLLAYMGWGV